MHKIKGCLLLAAMLLCGCSAPYSDVSGTDASVSAGKTAALPAEAERRLREYLKCESMEALAEFVLPSSLAGEMKSGKLTQGNYFFSGFPGRGCTDIVISEVEALPEDQAQRMAAFLAASVSIQGVDADIAAKEGYYAVAAATYAFSEDGGADAARMRVTRKVLVLHTADDEWIMMPTACSACISTEKMYPA